jgi:hypothetical protein
MSDDNELAYNDAVEELEQGDCIPVLIPTKPGVLHMLTWIPSDDDVAALEDDEELRGYYAVALAVKAHEDVAE